LKYNKPDLFEIKVVHIRACSKISSSVQHICGAMSNAGVVKVCMVVNMSAEPACTTDVLQASY
jgi:hypothetical protein